MSESAAERTPPPVRKAKEVLYEYVQANGGKCPDKDRNGFNVSERTWINARFTFKGWAALITLCCGLSAFGYAGYRDIVGEQARQHAAMQELTETIGKNSEANRASDAKLSAAITDLSIAVGELRGTIRTIEKINSTGKGGVP